MGIAVWLILGGVLVTIGFVCGCRMKDVWFLFLWLRLQGVTSATYIFTYIFQESTEFASLKWPAGPTVCLTVGITCFHSTGSSVDCFWVGHTGPAAFPLMGEKVLCSRANSQGGKSSSYSLPSCICSLFSSFCFSFIRWPRTTNCIGSRSNGVNNIANWSIH